MNTRCAVNKYTRHALAHAPPPTAFADQPKLRAPQHINLPSKFVSPSQVSSTAQQQIKTFNIPERETRG